MKDAYLVLANGKAFKGKGFGAIGQATGEVVFTTGMTGYLETLTDPAYYGQIITMTFPMIGNYGIIPGDFESRYSFVSGLIVKEWCERPSNFRSEATLDEFLKQQNIPGLYGVDTRAITMQLRSSGVMNGIITPDPSAVDMELLRAHDIGEAISKVSCADHNIVNTASEASAQEPPAQLDKHAKNTGNLSESADGVALNAAREAHEIPGREFKVALWDFGARDSLSQLLAKSGCRIEAYHYGAAADSIIAAKPDGIVLSGGPGDPAVNTGIIEGINELTQSGIPIFGVCLGHQLLALARGGKTEKMKFGHRGANHPVRDNDTGRVMITSQNHGYAVSADGIPSGASMRYTNVNDGSCEGIDYHNFPGFSVQFHPESAAGPNDTNFLLDRFINLMGDK